MISNSLDPQHIDAALVGTPFAGRMHHFVTIDSTNTHALHEARSGAAHGSFYVADEQTAGRGRGGHSWHSDAGDGLYLSVLLRPEIATVDLAWLPLLAGLAAHRAIGETSGLAADLRWPNDLLIGPRKAGGILVESQTEPDRVAAVVVGIGINLHQRQFPPDLATPATSLDLETGRFISRQGLLIELLRALGAELAVLGSASGRAAIPERVATVSTWVRGRRVAVHGPQECTGITAGLDDRGFLRVQTGEGLVTITTGGLRDLAVD
jgi:BirA family transcriptional regulator, biotin operon repressor / biotin---[acetyl-CoA-carboxylase] ligase